MREGKRGMGDPHLAGSLGCAAVEPETRPSAGFAEDLDFQPVHALTDAGPESLGSGFLGGEAGGQAFGGMASAHAVGLLGRRVYAIKKPGSEAIQRALDAIDLHQIYARADDHIDYESIPVGW